MSREAQQELLDAFSSHVSPQKVAAYRLVGWDFIPGRREGVRVWDWEEKRSWIDCRTAGGVFNLGHRPPAIVEALRRGLEETDMGDHMLASGYRARLAKRLAELTPGDLQYTTFGVSGGEAIDFAIKLALGYTGRSGVISSVKGYHGHTGLALFFFSSRRRHTRWPRDWSSDVCSSDLAGEVACTATKSSFGWAAVFSA